MTHRRRIVRTALILIAAGLILRYVVYGRQVGEDSLVGLTTQQVLTRYGEPNFKHQDGDEEDWVYYRGVAGGGTGITFKHGVVIDVGVRYVR